jgi:esterase/lipase superfamily enzyme
MHREHHCWYSPHLGHNMDLLVFGHAGARVLVFPTRAGRYYDYENWGQVDAIRHKIDNGWLQLFCVDSIDAQSFYCDWCRPQDRIHRHLQYENYLLHEVLPFTRYLNHNIVCIAHGCSLGAFHAMNFALRHPDVVGKVVAFSGRYDLTSELNEFRDLFDGHYDETIYFNTPTHFVPNIHDPYLLDLLRRMEITFAVGEDDPFLASNQALSQALASIDVPHQFIVAPGRAHRPKRWFVMAEQYL